MPNRQAKGSYSPLRSADDHAYLLTIRRELCLSVYGAEACKIGYILVVCLPNVAVREPSVIHHALLGLSQGHHKHRYAQTVPLPDRQYQANCAGMLDPHRDQTNLPTWLACIQAGKQTGRERVLYLISGWPEGAVPQVACKLDFPPSNILKRFMYLWHACKYFLPRPFTSSLSRSGFSLKKMRTFRIISVQHGTPVQQKRAM